MAQEKMGPIHSPEDAAARHSQRLARSRGTDNCLFTYAGRRHSACRRSLKEAAATIWQPAKTNMLARLVILLYI